MFIAGFQNFLVVWFVILTLVYMLSGRFVGITPLFAMTVMLYVLLPHYFFPNDANLFGTLLATVVLGILGFHVGLTAFSGLSERRLLSFPPRADIDQIGRAAVVLMMLSLSILFMLRPGFFAEVGTYAGHIDFRGRHGPLAFLLNQGVISGAVLIIWSYRRAHILLALVITVLLIAWAVYASEKGSLLALSAAWLSILLFATWQGRVRKGFTLVLLSVLLPSSVLVMIFYAVLRGGITDLSLATEVFASNLDRLGDVGGVNVGDFSGPYWVFTEHLRDKFLGLPLGATYVEQLLVLIPRVLRGEFLDLTDAFARQRVGAAYSPGLGFGFSPWAEAYMNFRIAGFFIQGLLFGLLTRLLMQGNMRLSGLNELVIFFQIVLFFYFERNHLIGQIKATAVFCLPYLATYLVLDLLKRRPPLKAAAFATNVSGAAGRMPTELIEGEQT